MRHESRKTRDTGIQEAEMNVLRGLTGYTHTDDQRSTEIRKKIKGF